jgi:beta-1,2-mannobiose phosphorylase / 1,2-beta-oligomannan phosphorylase
VSTVILDPSMASGVSILEFRQDDPDLKVGDPRAFTYKDQTYLTTLSHLRLACSDDGVNFQVEESPTLLGEGHLESFGIEDCRVTEIEGRFYLTYTAVSPNGVGVGMMSTSDWRNFTRHGMIFPPTNKDCALFPEKVGGNHFALHRPSGIGLGGNFIWISRSPDLVHWGEHDCIASARPGMWDSVRIGAGASPIWTAEGWLEIYHGADEQNRYCLGAILLDLEDPGKVIARSQEPLMEPLMEYEIAGFFGNVIFTNGFIVSGDDLTLYYGASDAVICGARFSIKEVLRSLE